MLEIWYTNAHFVVRNCTLYFGNLGATGTGIDLRGALNGLFENCIFSGQMTAGLNAYESQFEMYDCTFQGSFNYAITIGECYDVKIRSSSFQGANTALMIGLSDGVLIENNTFEENNQGAYIFISSAIALRGNHFTGGSGLRVENVDGCAVENNTWVDVDYMVNVQYCSGLVLGNNTANGSEADCGLNIFEGDGAWISNNQLMGFTYGSYISESDHLDFVNNALNDNYRGAYFNNCPNSAVIGNEFSNNDELGLLLTGNCNGMLVERNRFLDNVLYGLSSSCNGATITLNFFDGNNGNDGNFTEETMQGWDQSGNNQWQRDGFGNYWSDWTSPDGDGDGIVDMPYGSGEFETDLYPLVHLFGTPIDLSAEVGPNFVNLSWGELSYDFGEGIDGYNVYRGLTPDERVLLGTTSDMWYNDTSVTLGVEYYYRVSAYVGAEEGALSDWILAIPCDLPGAPTGLTVIAGLHSFQLSWTAPADDGGSPILGYAIWRGVSPISLVLFDTVGTTAAYTDLLVGDNETWYYAVAAFNQAGDGEMSDVVGNTTFSFASAPLNVTTQFGNGNVTVSWSAPANDGGTPVTGYVIEYVHALVGNFAWPGADDRSWLITGLTNGWEYSFRVLAVNVVGDGAWSPEVFDTPATVPGVPEDLLTATGTGTVQLSWLPPTNDGGAAPTLYNVYRMELDGDWAWIGNSTILMYEDANVTDGMAYFYRISAVNKAGEGGV